jgi:hypothetical protein
LEERALRARLSHQEVFAKMKSALFAVVVALGVGMMGCATSVDDPVTPAPAPEEQQDPPAQTLSGQLRTPQGELLTTIAVDHGFENVASKQHLPGPEPIPEALPGQK